VELFTSWVKRRFAAALRRVGATRVRALLSLGEVRSRRRSERRRKLWSPVGL